MSNSLKVIKVRRKTTTEAPTPVNAPAVVCPDREYCREFLQALIRGLVDQPETISVNYFIGERTTVYKVDCQQQSLGQIIGAKGRNISGIRTVISATMARKGIRAIIEIPYYTVSSAA